MFLKFCHYFDNEEKHIRPILVNQNRCKIFNIFMFIIIRSYTIEMKIIVFEISLINNYTVCM